MIFLHNGASSSSRSLNNLNIQLTQTLADQISFKAPGPGASGYLATQSRVLGSLVKQEILSFEFKIRKVSGFSWRNTVKCQHNLADE